MSSARQKPRPARLGGVLAAIDSRNSANRRAARRASQCVGQRLGAGCRLLSDGAMALAVATTRFDVRVEKTRAATVGADIALVA